MGLDGVDYKIKVMNLNFGQLKAWYMALAKTGKDNDIKTAVIKLLKQ